MSLLSEIVRLRTYSKLKDNGTKETWGETVERYLQMMREKYPDLQESIPVFGRFIHEKKILPSMRALQFAGSSIQRESARIFNCSFLAMDNVQALAELFYLLMCGTGVGYSVQQHHIDSFNRSLEAKRVELANITHHVIEDSREGWSNSIVLLLANPSIEFEYNKIRPAGAAVSSGGTASGPEPLRRAHQNIRAIVSRNSKLTPLQVHDICCYIADVVVVGGVRRAAMISLFDKHDTQMLQCKSGSWWEANPQRARANNSAVLVRGETSKEEFDAILDQAFESKAGEPGIFWTSHRDLGTNPCFKAGTLIMTRAGVYPIESLIGKTVEVFDGNDWVTCSNFRVTGTNKQVMKITLHDGSTIEVTPNHTMILEDGTRKQASQLEVNDKLAVSKIFLFKNDVMSDWNRIVKLELGEIEKEVYCCTVPSTNSIALANGIQIGQCGEIALNSNQFCNLTTINFSTVENLQDFVYRARAATFFGTLQAGFTDFNYLRPEWAANTKREALLGVSMTGLGDNWKTFEAMAHSGDIASVTYAMKEWNQIFAEAIGVEPAARITTVKPEGTTSTILDTTSGIHAAHAEYYLRRIRLAKENPLANFLDEQLRGTEFLEDDIFNSSNLIVTIPMAMPGAVTREQETALDQLNRMKLVREVWIEPGHRYGANHHNVSITVSYNEEERGVVKQWMWEHRFSYNGISLLPYDGGTYVQAPFERISQERYRELKAKLPNLDLDSIVYENRLGEENEQRETVACGAGGCELR